MENTEYPDEIKFNIESNPEEGFYALYAGLRMLKERESAHSEAINKTAPDDRKLFSITGAESYCMLQSMLEEHPVYYALAEKRFNEEITFTI